MYTFLVLGLIPGTNIQINFYAWIIIVIGVSITGYRLRLRIMRRLSSWWHQFDEPEARQPLHANQLHLRGL